jgi:hypothetical protein
LSLHVAVVVVVVVGMSEKLWWCKSGTLCPRRKEKKRTNKRGMDIRTDNCSKSCDVSLIG